MPLFGVKEHIGSFSELPPQYWPENAQKGEFQALDGIVHSVPDILIPQFLRNSRLRVSGVQKVVYCRICDAEFNIRAGCNPFCSRAYFSAAHRNCRPILDLACAQAGSSAFAHIRAGIHYVYLVLPVTDEYACLTRDFRPNRDFCKKAVVEREVSVINRAGSITAVNRNTDS